MRDRAGTDDGKRGQRRGIRETRGHAVVVQPGTCPSFWQPMPANGHVDAVLTPTNTRLDSFSMGYRTIAPGGHVPEHSHRRQVQWQICFRGSGHILVEGVPHPLVPGTICFLGEGVKHEVWNDAQEDLVMIWAVSPAGLEEFFATIGRWRHPGERAPAPFASRDDIVDIETRMDIKRREGPERSSLNSQS